MSTSQILSTSVQSCKLKNASIYSRMKIRECGIANIYIHECRIANEEKRILNHECRYNILEASPYMPNLE